MFWRLGLSDLDPPLEVGIFFLQFEHFGFSDNLHFDPWIILFELLVLPFPLVNLPTFDLDDLVSELVEHDKIGDIGIDGIIGMVPRNISKKYRGRKGEFCRVLYESRDNTSPLKFSEIECKIDLVGGREAVVFSVDVDTLALEVWSHREYL